MREFAPNSRRMNIKLLLRLFVILTVFSVSSPGVAMAQAPIPPVLFRGDVNIDGVAAPLGTIVAAEVDGIEAATNTPDGIKETGKYMLAVPDNGYIGKMVVFKVNDIVTGEHEYVSSMDTPVIELDLDVITKSSDTSGGSDTGSTAPGTTADSSSGLFGLGTGAMAGIVVGIVVAAVVAVLLVRRRKRR